MLKEKIILNAFWGYEGNDNFKTFVVQKTLPLRVARVKTTNILSVP